MHILSSKRRDEFLAVPSCVRIELSSNGEAWVPTVLIKASSVEIAYITHSKELRVFAYPFLGKVLYGLAIDEGDVEPAIVWSIAETLNEKYAISSFFSERDEAIIHIFNDLAFNTFTGVFPLHRQVYSDQILSCELEKPFITSFDKEAVGSMLDIIRQPSAKAYGEATIEISASFVSHVNQTVLTSGQILSHDESRPFGNLQEEFVGWFSDTLMFDCFAVSPDVKISEEKSRELCDVILSHEYGAILFESKSLEILSEAIIPARHKLPKSIEKHIQKALKQLGGAVRNLQLGLEISKDGKALEVPREPVAHAVVLIPDLSLVMSEESNSFENAIEFYEKRKAMLHILDPTQILRMVQGAIKQSENSHIRISAHFDYLLIERWKKCSKVGKLNIQILYH